MTAHDAQAQRQEPTLITAEAATGQPRAEATLGRYEDRMLTAF